MRIHRDRNGVPKWLFSTTPEMSIVRRDRPKAEVPKRSLPPGHQYIGGCGMRAQRRYLRQRFRLVERLKDPASISALARLRESVADDPDPAFALLHLAHVAHVALQAAEDCRGTWAESVRVMLRKFDERARA